MIYDPKDWYWVKQDGTVYSSARQKVYAPSNAEYKAWLGQGNRPTPFPSDNEGLENEAELAEVLAVYGLALWPADQKLAAIERLTAACASAIVGGYTSSALGSPHSYPSGVTDQINMMGSVTASLLPELPTDWTTPFWCADADGVWLFRDHTAVQIRDAGSAGKMHVVTCQGTLDYFTAQVMAAETAEEVNAISWPD